MANELNKGRAVLLVMVMTFVFSTSGVLAFSPFKSVRSVGFLTVPTVVSDNEAGIKSISDCKNPFFDTLGLALSGHGAVKTYSVKVVKTTPKRKLKKTSSKKIAYDPVFGTMMMPVSGRISSPFGRRRHPRSRKMQFHSGLDIAARKGTPIVCASEGQVVFVGWKAGYGKTIVVDHGNGLKSVYAHCSKFVTRKGQTVNAGQRIAYVGNTGVATGAHLHFEVRRNGRALNPFRCISR